MSSRFQRSQQYAKKARKQRTMDNGEVREAEAKGHRFYPLSFCPKCNGRAHERKEARSLR